MSGAGILQLLQAPGGCAEIPGLSRLATGQEIIAHSISFEYPIASGVKTVQPETPFSELKPNPIDIAQLGTGATAIALCARFSSCDDSAVSARDAMTTPLRARPRFCSGRPLPQFSPAPRRRRPVGLMSASSSSPPSSPCLSPSCSRGRGLGRVDVWHLIWRCSRRAALEHRRLTVVVTALCAVIGTLAAYGIERTDLVGRRIWAVLVVVPFAIPDFVVSFGWFSLSTWVQGFKGAVVVMTLAVYPLVYLPVAASLRAADPGQEEIARSLGASGLATFFRVTLAQARRAILGGCLLVALVILAEYGAFEILGFQTFTTEIFTEFNVGLRLSAACALSLVLVLLSFLVLAGEGVSGGTGRLSRVGPGAQRVLVRRRLGRWQAWCSVPHAVGAGCLGSSDRLVRLLDLRGRRARHHRGPARVRGTPPVGYSLCAAARGDAHGPAARTACRSAPRSGAHGSSSGDIPGSRRSRPGDSSRAFLLLHPLPDSFGYQTAPLLIVGYAIMFFPLALVGVRASVAQAPVSLEEVAGALGGAASVPF